MINYYDTLFHAIISYQDITNFALQIISLGQLQITIIHYYDFPFMYSYIPLLNDHVCLMKGIIPAQFMIMTSCL